MARDKSTQKLIVLSMGKRIEVWMQFLGPRYVCVEEHKKRISEYLECRLWEDPVEEVRLEVAKAVIALDMFPFACERAEK